MERVQAAKFGSDMASKQGIMSVLRVWLVMWGTRCLELQSGKLSTE